MDHHPDAAGRMGDGEQLPAWIQLVAGETLSEDDVEAYCRDQIAHCKVPHRVQFVDTFPMTVTGKIEKHEIREQAIAELGL